MRKRTIGMLAAAALAAALTCTAAFAEEVDVTGAWYMQSMEQEGQVYDASMLASFGMTGTITLGEDGSVAIEFTGEDAVEGTYTWDGAAGEITSDGESVPFTLEEDQLVMEQEGVKMVYGRDMPEAEAFELAEAVADAQLADFNGVWAAETFVMAGMPLPMEALGMEMVLTIEDGKVTSKTTYTSESTDETEAAEPDVMEQVYEGELTNGVLAGTTEDGEAFKLELREDGTMTMTNGEAAGEAAGEEETEAMSEEADLSIDFPEMSVVFIKVE